MGGCRQTHVGALFVPISLDGRSIDLVFCGSHLTYTARHLYPACEDALVRKAQIQEIHRFSQHMFPQATLLLVGDLNMRTHPHAFTHWKSVPRKQLERQFLVQDWPLGTNHSWPEMSDNDWISNRHWAQSSLWRGSELVREWGGARNVLGVSPNFPPTYQFSGARYGIAKMKKECGTMVDMRPPSWTDQLMIFNPS
eukprot:NODE_3580_length_757_cov_61.029661_g3000_i0.p1 GENE.NODE_3580_length_757_cov_61.029661_g3000_i0~~NODE_3580_length_757_cov_61.029661_g3000_i0.p1  ORF type:complete len:205 (-),score=43.63 NODE_3580_length_757_cov_61.029661_g3000_i0:142-729(-)